MAGTKAFIYTGVKPTTPAKKSSTIDLLS